MIVEDLDLPMVEMVITQVYRRVRMHSSDFLALYMKKNALED